MNDQSQWLRYIESQIGFILPSSQLQWLANAVQATAKKHTMTVNQLWETVHRDGNVRRDLLDSTLIVESRFFRHPPSIDFVMEQAIKYHGDKNIEQFKIWSVGCSEGQEAWSLAMSLSQFDSDKFHVFGTDISSRAIDSAKSATYSRRYLTEIPNKYLNLVEDIESPLKISLINQDKKWKVSEKIHSQTSFFLHNIFNDIQEKKPTPLLLRHNIIYCQNMLIYFRQFDQRDILSRLVTQCDIGGHIVLAPNEAYFWQHPQMERVNNEYINAWKKIK